MFEKAQANYGCYLCYLPYSSISDGLFQKVTKFGLSYRNLLIRISYKDDNRIHSYVWNMELKSQLEISINCTGCVLFLPCLGKSTFHNFNVTAPEINKFKNRSIWNLLNRKAKNSTLLRGNFNQHVRAAWLSDAVQPEINFRIKKLYRNMSALNLVTQQITTQWCQYFREEKSLHYHPQRSCRKVMFSVSPVSTTGGVLMWPLPMMHCISLYRDPTPTLPPDMFKLVHYEAHTFGSGQFASYWNVSLFENIFTT